MSQVKKKVFYWSLHSTIIMCYGIGKMKGTVDVRTCNVPELEFADEFWPIGKINNGRNLISEVTK